MLNVDAGHHGQQECCSTVLLQEPRRDTDEVFKDRYSSDAISVLTTRCCQIIPTEALGLL